MDRTFLAYYESELSHLRSMAEEFAALHPTVARNLSLDTAPCPDPYVERLLEGVAFLGARTRLKLDYEASRHVRGLLDALYPDLAAPAPAMTLAVLNPGAQVDGMVDGHEVARGTRLVAGLREGMSTRAVYSTAQPVELWPIRIVEAEYLQDRGALKSAGLSDNAIGTSEAGMKLVVSRTSPGSISDFSLNKLDLYLGGAGRGGVLFDALVGHGSRVVGRAAGTRTAFTRLGEVEMVGIADGEGLLPRVRPSFEGYRLLREYFLMPERFHYVRLTELNPAVRQSIETDTEFVILLDHADLSLADVTAADFVPFVTPIVNLFERECNIVELDPRRNAHVVHADRTRPRDFEIYRLLRVEDAEREGRSAELVSLFTMDQQRGNHLVYSTDRKPRRPSDDETAEGQMRTSYPGDDYFISVARPVGARDVPNVRRLDIRALCTNRDLPILDDTPELTLETGDPVGNVKLLQAMRRPRASLSAALPGTADRGEADMDDLTWRWIAQLGLNHLTLGEEGPGPLHALLALYSDRGDPALRRHGRSITGVTTKPVIDRVAIPGPICFAHGTEITLEVDDSVLSGSSRLLLSALLAKIFARHAAVNSFARTRTRLTHDQQEIRWPNAVGTRSLI